MGKNPFFKKYYRTPNIGSRRGTKILRVPHWSPLSTEYKDTYHMQSRLPPKKFPTVYYAYAHSKHPGIPNTLFQSIPINYTCFPILKNFLLRAS